jgi:penicillin-binding protein 1A
MAARTKESAKGASKVWRVVRVAALLLVGLSLSGVIALAGIFWFYGRDLPRILAREDFQPPQMTRIYSVDGEVIDELVAADGRRTLVPFEAISPTMRDAILAAEDADFYRHQGLDYMGMARALYYAVRYDRAQGASTITQQVVKNLILTPERTLKRKVQEIMLARQLEEHLSKDDILYIYLNQIYFGNGNYGVEEASRDYFGKPASELSLPEAASLAGLVQSPERLNPRKHPERNEARRRYVLEQMWQKGFVSEPQAKAAMGAALPVMQKRSSVDPHLHAAPYFSDHVRRQLEARYPGQDVSSMGLKVRTSLDLRKQAVAESSLRAQLEELDRKGGAYRPVERLAEEKIGERRRAAVEKLRGELYDDVVYLAVVLRVEPERALLGLGEWEGSLASVPRLNPKGGPLSEVLRRGDLLRVMVDKTYPKGARDVRFLSAPGTQGALVSMDLKTRQVEALVGGYDFGESSFNRATQARRQTGSAFKPVVYGAALERNVSTPSTVWLDAPKPYRLADGKVWDPKNSDGKYLGPLTMRRALAMSRNVIAVRLLEEVGIDQTQQFARSLGVTSPLVDNLTLGLGSSEMSVLELTNVYATLASQGRRGEPILIVSIHDAYGQLLYEARPELEETVRPEVAWLTVELMTSVLQEGTASKVGKALGRAAAGKTGTTNEGRDAWFVGFTPQKVAGVWIGNDDNSSLGRRATGGELAAPVWGAYMKEIHKGVPAASFERPPVGIEEAVIERHSGLLATEEHAPKQTRREYFLRGTAPTQYAPLEEEESAGDFLLEQE